MALLSQGMFFILLCQNSEHQLINFTTMSNSKLLILSLLTLLAGCAVTGPADDGYDNSNEWVDNGRLLSEDTKTIYSSIDQKGIKPTNPDSNTNIDYDAYKQWQQAREQNSADYRKFKQWQEFEEYKRWKEQQAQ